MYHILCYSRFRLFPCCYLINIKGVRQIDIRQALKRSRDTWFQKAMGLFERQTLNEAAWIELEELLIGADVGVNTTEKLLDRLKQRVQAERVTDSAAVGLLLQVEMVDMLTVNSDASLPVKVKPRVTLAVGVNGGGKTTSIAKLAYRSQQEGRQVLLAAADTFRAAAIDQLRRWADKIGVEVVAHQPGADPGAVVYDTMQAARSRGVDEVIIDTAGRLHTKLNLMEELKKIKRVAAKTDPTAPHEVILVVDATTGQNGLAQARHFTEAVGVTGIFLAKLDGTARGGIVLAICDELRIPVRYIGTGEGVEDIATFDARAFVTALCTEA